IDDERGIGIPLEENSVSSELGSARRDDELVNLSKKRAAAKQAPPPRDGMKEHSIPFDPQGGRPPLSERDRAAEHRNASKALQQSKQAVIELFDDARMGNAVKPEQMTALVGKISTSIARDPSIFLNIAKLKTKDEYTFLHSVSVCALMINLARTMELDETKIQECGMAGLLHDVGKMGVPDHILSKPGSLDDEEFRIVRDHPVIGHKILSGSADVTEMALDVCLHHHEKIDGTGYPHKLAGEDISLTSRMAAICDVYDAVTSQRSYNIPWTSSDALSKMQSWTGHFDPLIFQLFVESLGILPMGTLVRLRNNRLAIVIGEDSTDFTLPKLRTFYSTELRSLIPHYDVAASRSDYDHAVISIEDPLDWEFDDWTDRKSNLLALTE
ncbi:MAG: HD-GYP domain-containing protein, partial [Sphingorhabdus sp.]